ncbi:MAG: NAD(+) synthase [Chloroflexi bacterium RBG_13_53_26]|jgi:NAD+ synthase (glutamine-hydrolysing)|nr:MAG: NAD(+) synthase [Chloroflexi bacterium RBG_13_53_26]
MSDVQLNKDLGFLRIGAAVPELRVADVDFNAGAIIEVLRKAKDEGVQVLTFPEMALTGYTIGDLVYQRALLAKAERGLGDILNESAGNGRLVVVGMPLSVDQKIFNCAVVLNSGRILGVIPKTLLASYKEFYEDRWFSPSRDASSDTVELVGQRVPFGSDLLFGLEGIPAAVIGVEICEDMWMPLSPHEYQALAGATVLLNLSASNEVLAKSDWRRTMVSSESGRCIAAYCYASSGIGESSNDVVYGGHVLIAENGVILQESNRFSSGSQLIVSDIDLDRLNHDRRVMTSFHDVSRQARSFRVVKTEVDDPAVGKLRREIDPHPFVPADPARRAERCRDIFSMQVAAMAKKLSGANRSRMVLGISGGIDSTLTLLVAVKTADFLGLPRSNVHTYTLPGFGTTRRTRDNATKLCRALGVSFERVNITKTCMSHLRDLRHGGQEDVVFENVQARYRTEFLFNKANEFDGIVLGTGDLTEVALGWCTFAGDHMSHYHVSISVPKTLVRFLVRWVADEEMADSPAQKVLRDILETPISPELLRPENGEIAQRSEEVIGPVELADFYLYPFVRFGTRPGKILFLADEVRKRGLFEGQYAFEDLHQWLKSFIQRFFANQFKRTCLPEGPKVGSVSLSPRGDWRMPSDAEAKLWLEDLEAMYAKLRVRE